MTYYEEFGIPSSATAQEIHKAHRRLIKILHPDLQTEPKARQLAETQTRRINRIAQILLDPVEREDYETSLLLQLAPVPPGVKPNRSPNRARYATAVNFAVIGLFVLAGLWILQSEPPIPTQRVMASPSGAVPRPGSAAPMPARIEDRRTIPLMTTPPKSEHESHTSSVDPGGTVASDQPETPVKHPETAEANRDDPALRQLEASTGNQPMPIEDQRRESASADEHNPFIGTWVYIPAQVLEEDRRLYRPEYIEMRIRDVNGILEGQYRARYHVPDRPLSPNVGFHFAGPPGEGSAAFRWSGSNGQAGKVELKLVSARSIQVDWQVTELAKSADLVSGTAVLTRVQ
jgi:hypothetical protein